MKTRGVNREGGGDNERDGEKGARKPMCIGEGTKGREERGSRERKKETEFHSPPSLIATVMLSFDSASAAITYHIISFCHCSRL